MSGLHDNEHVIIDFYLLVPSKPKKSVVLDGFIDDFYQILIEDIKPILYNLFPKLEEKEILSNSFYEAESNYKKSTA